MIQTLSDALRERGYDALTPVQEAVTDPALEEADLLVSAQTGSGKTVGFGLAIAPTLLGASETFGPAEAPLALIVAPTRELAFQVMRELGWLYAKAGAQVASCVGGMDMRNERRALERGAHIVVGTPGRLRDHIQRGSLDLGAIRAVVLDEADEMLDLGFREDLEFMLAEAPAERRTLLFSATVPPAIATLAKSYQRDAVRVTTLSERSQHADIAYKAVQVAEPDAENAIVNLLLYHDAANAIVFANTRAAVNRLTARFANRGFATVCLSGELSQTERTHALQAMRDGRARVCVATDVAARGIDLPNLELVVHAELPTNGETLLHRSGRTGRAGRKGTSALIVPPKQAKKAERLLKMAKVSADWAPAPGAEDILRLQEDRLLTDPSWAEEISDEEAAFAKRLLAEQSPEAVAAAYLRLYRARHSAPEDLLPPDARPPARERAPFGPSVWFAVSVGRDDRAEPRWLLPLLCRAGGLTKEAIGAIRIQKTQTFVELAETSVPGFLKAIGPKGELEDGVTAVRTNGPPDASHDGGKAPGKRPFKSGKPPQKFERPLERTEREKPARAKEARDVERPRPAQSDAPQKPDGKPKKPKTAPAAAPKERTDKSEPRKKHKAKPGSKGAADTSKRFTPKPGKAGAKPRGKPPAKSKPGGMGPPKRRKP